MFWRRNRSELDFADEIESHIHHEADQLMREGATEADAFAAARRTFGNVARARETYDITNRFRLVQVFEDFRYSLRTLRLAPGFAIAGIASLSVGIAFNTALFSTLYALVLRPLPLPDGDQVVMIYHDFKNFTRQVNGSLDRISHPEYLNHRTHTRTLQGLAAYADIGLTVNADVPVGAAGLLVSCNYFQVLRVAVVLGRGFSAGECESDGDAVAVLGHGFWQRRFGGDVTVLGKTVTLNRQSVKVIGVADPSFGSTGLRPHDLWLPLTMRVRLATGGGLLQGPMQGGVVGPNWRAAAERPADHYESWLQLIGRLQPDQTIEAARTELNATARRADAEYPGRSSSVSVYPATRLSGVDVHEERTVGSLIVIGIGALIVMMACLNLMNLLLARAPARQRAVRIRLALGASRARVISLLMMESLVLAVFGGLAGLAIGTWVPRFILPHLPARDMQLDFSPDLRMFAYALIVSMLSALVFGLTPALESTRVDLAAALRGDSAGGGRRTGMRLRHSVVALQIAGSLALLVVAGLFIRAVLRADAIDPGYIVSGIHSFNADVGRQGYDNAGAAAFYRELEARVRALPGVHSTALSKRLPMRGRSTGELEIFGPTPDPAAGYRQIDYTMVGAGYFETMGVPILRGRGFTEMDARAPEPTPAVVNVTMADRFWPGTNAVGRRFRAGTRQYEVVGVARNARNITLSRPDPPFFYAALAATDVDQTLVVRTAETAAIAPSVTRIVRELDADLLLRSNSFAELMQNRLTSARVTGWIASIVGVLATLLAAMGVYGAIDYAAGQRKHEIGVRLALGATPRDVVKLVLRDGATPVVLGLVGGIGLAIAGAQFVRGMLYGLNPLDPVAFVGMIALLATTAFLAMYRPARRAARLDPSVTLRSD
ncbi:MAG: ABC transporter permease [Gemmatimonadota bacterium]